MIKYEINDKVIFRTNGKLPNGKLQVGVITNRRSADKKTYYDLRSEAGQGFVLVPVDKARNKYSDSYAVIDSKMTESWNKAADAGDVTPTRLFAKDGVGHTRGNFADNIDLYFDGENGGVMGQMEKRNDFIFPTQGPRSF
jgi:hypothetical protein